VNPDLRLSAPSSRRMRPPLLVTTSTFPVKPDDGVPRFVLDLAVALSHYFGVTVLTPHSPGAKRLEEINGVQVVRFRYFLPTRWQRLSRGGSVAVNLDDWLARLQVPFLLAAETLATRRLLRITGSKVVNAHWLIPQGLTAALALRLSRGRRLVVHVHAKDVYFLERYWFGSSLARFVVSRASVVLADGSHVSKSLDTLVGKAVGANLRPMGVWSKRFHRPADSSRPANPTVVFVGRFVEKKGVPYLLQAFSKVREERPDVRLVLIGGGPLEPQLRDEVVELGISESVVFTGPLPHEEVIQHLHRADVACVTSIIDSRGETDGMPTVVLEAMAAGLRVVGTEVDGIPDVLRDRENGWLARAADAADLAARLLEALEDPDRARLAEAGRRTAEQHDWDRVAAEYARYLGAVADV